MSNNDIANAVQEAIDSEGVGVVLVLFNKFTGGITISIANCDERVAVSVLAAAQEFVEQSVSIPKPSIN